MKEQEAIDQAYQATLAGLFNVFFSSYTAAKGDAAGEQQAEEHFQKGILHARHVYSRAIDLLAQ